MSKAETTGACESACTPDPPRVPMQPVGPRGPIPARHASDPVAWARHSLPSFPSM